MYLFGDGDSYKLDMQTQVIQTIFNPFVDKNNGLGMMVYGDTPCVVGNSVLYPAVREDAVIEFDMERECFVIHELQKRNSKYNTIAFDGGNFWLSGNQRNIVRWDRDKKEEEVLDIFPEGFGLRDEKATFLFTISIVMKNEIFFMPWNANMLLKMNLKNKKIEKLKKFPENVMCWFAKKWDDTYIYTEICNENYSVLKESIIIDADGSKVEDDVFVIKKDLDKILEEGIVEGMKNENNFRDLKILLGRQ